MEPQLPTIKNVFVNETDDDDPPALSSQALAALKEFLEEQRQSLANHETAENGEGTLEPESEVALVTEDWRLSQFWYDPETARTLSQEVLSLCSHSNYKVACIACPTLYAYLKKIDPNISVQLLEYDKRFEQYGSDFTFYDYNQPKDLPFELKHTYQVVIADPPYLGEMQRDRAAELLGLRACNFWPRYSSKLGNEFRVFTNYDPGERLGGWEQEQ